jgi:hypothetical protein
MHSNHPIISGAAFVLCIVVWAWALYRVAEFFTGNSPFTLIHDALVSVLP